MRKDGDDMEIKSNFVEHMIQRMIKMRVEIGRWRGMTKLSPEDLGLNGNTEEVMRLGHKFLIPKSLINELDRIDTAARRAIYKWGFALQLWTLVPLANHAKVMAALDDLRTEYFGVLDKMMAEYAENKAAIIEEYRTFIMENDVDERLLQVVIDKIPLPSEIKTSFYFIVHEELVLPVTRDNPFFEEYMRAEMTESEQQALKDIYARKSEEVLTNVEGLYDTLFHSIRAEVNEKVMAALQDRQTKGEFTGGRIKSLKSLIDRIKIANPTDNEELTRWTEDLQKLISGSVKDDDEVKILAEIGRQTEESVKELKAGRARWLKL